MGISKNGYEITSEDEYFKEAMSQLKKEFPLMSEHPSNPLVIMARLWAKNESIRDFDRVQRYNNAYVATATGVHLDKVVSVGGLFRNSGKHAVGDVTITKDKSRAQIVIPSGTLLSSSGILYKTTNINAVIMNSDTVDMQVEALEVGLLGNIVKGSSFVTVSNIIGIKTIIAKTALEGGDDLETDAELRLRYYYRMNEYQNSSLNGLIAKVKEIKDVVKVSGSENTTAAVDANGAPPKSFTIYVRGGVNSDIARTIAEYKPAGVQSFGGVNETVVINGVSYSIGFSRFNDVTIYFDVEIEIDRTIAPADYDEKIKDVIVDFVNENRTLKTFELITQISRKLDFVSGVSKLNQGKSANPTTNTDIVAAPSEDLITNKTAGVITVSVI